MKKTLLVYGLFALCALCLAVLIVVYFNQQPAYIDSYYHYNGAIHLLEGRGFTEPYLWTYIGATGDLPQPSHLYWMSGTSLVAAFGMFFLGTNYAGAQVGLVLCLWGASLLTYWLGWRFAGQRQAWLAGLSLLCGGFFLRFWGQTDTFAPYTFFGALCLVLIGLGISASSKNAYYWFFAGLFAACGHLIRTDGLLLVLVAWAVLFFPSDWFRMKWQERSQWALIFTSGYAIGMAWWFLRNVQAIGTILPTGGTQALWYTSYDDLFRYPPDANPQTFFAQGLEAILRTRWWAVFSNEGAIVNFIAVESMIVLTPFILIALWQRRHDTFWRGVGIFALGIHVAFSLVFPFPGLRGGLFHAVAALMPFWMVLGYLGLDDAVTWFAKKRRVWKPKTAQPIFAIGVFLLILWLSLTVSLPQRQRHLLRDPQLYKDVNATFSKDTRVMINDTPQLWYYTGLSGIPIPNETPEIALLLAQNYEIDYLFVERGGLPPKMQIIQANLPSFLRLRNDLVIDGVMVYEFIRD